MIHVTVELWPMDLVLIRDKSSNLSTNSIDLQRLDSQTNGIIKYIGPKLDIQMIPWSVPLEGNHSGSTTL